MNTNSLGDVQSIIKQEAFLQKSLIKCLLIRNVINTKKDNVALSSFLFTDIWLATEEYKLKSYGDNVILVVSQPDDALGPLIEY